MLSAALYPCQNTVYIAFPFIMSFATVLIWTYSSQPCALAGAKSVSGGTLMSLSSSLSVLCLSYLLSSQAAIDVQSLDTILSLMPTLLMAVLDMTGLAVNW